MKYFSSYLLVALAFSTNTFAQNTPEELKQICKIENNNTDARTKYLNSFFEKNPVYITLSSLTNRNDNPYTNETTFTRYLTKCLELVSRDGKKEQKDCVSAHDFGLKLIAIVQTLHNSSHPDFLFSPQPKPINPSNNEEVETSLINFMREDFDGYEMRCKVPVSALPITEKESVTHLPKFAFAPKISVTKNDDTIGKTIDKKEAANLSFSIDRAKVKEEEDGTESLTKEEIYEANIAIGLEKFFTIRTGDLSIENHNSDLNIHLTPFVAWKYKSNQDAEKETDDLSLGIQLTQNLPDGYLLFTGIPGVAELNLGPSQYSITGSYITDLEQFESEQWAGEFRSPIANIELPNLFLSNYINFEAVIDHSEIDEIGDKVELKDIESYSRYGYDIRFFSQIAEFNDWSVIFDTRYQFRDTFGKNRGNADLVNMGLKFTPDSKSNFAYGLEYQKGEDLFSLKKVDTLKLTIDYKQ